MGRTACTEPQCLYKGALYLYLTVELYLYYPYGPYGLYRASVPVQGCTLPLPKSRAVPLLPLWAVRPVQSLSVCTRVHFTFTYTSTPAMARTACTEPQCLYKGALYLYLYSHYGPYGLYRTSVPVQGCTLPLPLLKPLLHGFVSISTPTLRPLIKFQKSIFAVGCIVDALIRNAP